MPKELKATQGYVRSLFLPLMAILFGAYFVLHSPLRTWVTAAFGIENQWCYFLCADALSQQRAVEIASGLAFLVSAFVAAWYLVELFDGASYEQPLVFGLSALGLIVGPAAMLGGIASSLGLSLLRPPAGPLLCALPSLFIAGIGLLRGWRPRRPQLALRQYSNLVRLIMGCAAGLLVASAAISVLRPPSGYDALGYHAPLSVFLWRDGNLTSYLDQNPGMWALSHPGTMELWSGLLLVSAGEALANLAQFPFALLGAGAVAAFARRQGLRAGSALLAGMAFLSAPLVVIQAGLQLNDIAGAALLMTTAALMCAPLSAWTSRRFVAIGAGAGLAVTTRLALLPAVSALLLFAASSLLWERADSLPMRVVARRSLLSILTFALLVSPWWVRNTLRFQDPLYPAATPVKLGAWSVSQAHAVEPVDEPRYVSSDILWPLYPLIEPYDDQSGFGALLAVAVAPGLSFALLRGRRRPLALYGLLALFMVPVWWTFPGRAPRLLLALAGLSFAFVPWALVALPRRRRRAGAVILGAAALFSLLLTFDQSLLTFARQPSDRVEFYDRIWGVDSVVATLEESEGILHQTGYAPYSYAAFYPLLGPSFSRRIVSVDTDATTERVVEVMRANGVHYAYVSASPEAYETVTNVYGSSHFELVHDSQIEGGPRHGIRRYLYRLND